LSGVVVVALISRLFGSERCVRFQLPKKKRRGKRKESREEKSGKNPPTMKNFKLFLNVLLAF